MRLRACADTSGKRRQTQLNFALTLLTAGRNEAHRLSNTGDIGTGIGLQAIKGIEVERANNTEIIVPRYGGAWRGRVADTRTAHRGSRLGGDTRGSSPGEEGHPAVRSPGRGKLAAVGLLGVGVAVLGERGTLMRSHSGSISQWLLLAPAALVAYIAQQRRHHYARFTTRYRVFLWLYTLVAMLFAGSITFGAPKVPFERLHPCGRNARDICRVRAHESCPADMGHMGRTPL